MSLSLTGQSYSEWIEIGLRQMHHDKQDSAIVSFNQAYQSDTLDHKIIAIRGILKASIFATEITKGDSLISIGDSLCQFQDFNKSVFLFQLAKAEFYKKESKYQKALKVYKDILPKAKSLSDLDKEYADGLQHYGLLYENLSKFDSCTYYMEKAKAIYVNKKDTTSVKYGLLLNNMGTAYLRLNELQKSKESFEKALYIFSNSENPSYGNIAMAKGNIGVILSREGKYKEANDITEEALADNRSINDLNGMSYNYYSMGVNNYYMGDYGRTKSYLDECIRIRTNLYGQMHRSLISPYDVKALALEEAGDYNGSTQNFQLARRIIKHVFKEPGINEGFNLENIATNFHNAGKIDSALVYAKEAHKVLENILPPVSFDMAVNYFTLGNIYIANNKVEDGKKWLENALKILDQLEIDEEMTTALLKITIGEVEARNMNWDRADKLYDEALEIAGIDENMDPQKLDASPDVLTVFDYYMSYLYNKYDAFQENKYLEEYQKYSDLYLLISEKLRRQFNDPYTKSTLVKNSVPVFRTQIGVYANLYTKTKKEKYLEDLFQQAEYSRATMIRDMQDEKIASYARVDKETIKQEEKLKQTLADANAEYFQFPDSTAIKSNLFKAKEAFNQFVSITSKENPEYFDLKYGGNIPEISAVQNKLKTDQVLIEYMIDDTAYYALTITSEKSDLFYLGVRDSIDNYIIAYRNQIKQNKIRDFESEKKLYAHIWAPITTLETHHRVIVCPISSLHYLNLETLKNEADNKYLIEDYNISYTLSANIFLNTNPAQKQKKSLAIAIAPGFEDELKNDYKSQLDSTDQIDDTYMHTIRQPWSVKLAEKLKREYRHKVHIGNQALESKVKASLSQGNIIYFGTHAITNEHDPLRSKLVLSKELGDQDEDGYLHAYEIYGLDLQADLTVLSACESGIGQLEDGEGMISLAHSIHYAGCPSTILSMWKVDEKSNTHIIDLFLENIAKGQIKSEALRNAKLEFLSSDPDAHPYLWGGMVLMGQDGPIKLIKQNNIILYLILTLLLIVVIIMLARKKKK